MTYTIVYFNARGRAELARLIAEEGKIPYQNEFVQYQELANLKPSLPFGQLPVLKKGDFVLAQSIAIARHLATKAKLIPEDAEQAALADMYVDGVVDWTSAMVSAFFSTPEEKEAKVKQYCEQKLPSFLERYEGFLQKSGTYLLGDQFSWADVALFAILEQNETFMAPMVDKYPHIKKLKDTVSARPNIAAYIANPNRPKNFGG